MLPVALLLAVPVLAQSQMRHEEAHQHGVSALNVAVDGNTVAVELAGPMVNFVGFEHEPGNEDEQAALDQAVSRLNDPAGLLALNSQAECSTVSASVLTPVAEADEAHDEEHGEDSAHDDDHADHDDEHEGHLEIHASYEFLCQHPGRLNFIDLRLFSVFPATESVAAQVLGVSSVLVQELSPGDTRLQLQD